MELMQELFLTVLLAIVLSFLVVKLVSMAMSGDSGLSQSSNDDHISADTNEFHFTSGGERLTVQTSQRETKVEAIASLVQQVDRIQCQFQRKHPVQVDNSVEIEHLIKEITTEEADELHFPEDTATDNSGRQPHVAELPEKSPEQTPEDDDAIFLCEQKEECDMDDTAKQRSEDHVVSSEEISVETSSENEIVAQSKGIFRVDEESDLKEIVEEKKDFEGEEEEEEEDDDDGWEGIERTELEKVFASAAKFVDGEGTTDERLSRIGSAVQMKMYGLQRIAIEGPCREPQPMALKTSARAKWY